MKRKLIFWLIMNYIGFIRTNFDSLDNYSRGRFNGIEYMINELDNDDLTLIITRCYQMIKACWIDESYETIETTEEKTTGAS